MGGERTAVFVALLVAWAIGCGASRSAALQGGAPAASRGEMASAGGDIELEASASTADYAAALEPPSAPSARAPSVRAPSFAAALAPAQRGSPLATKQTAADDSTADEAATAPKPSVLLIYTAQLQLAVFEVEDKQRDAIAAVEKLGGFLSEQAGDRLVLRVPAAQFKLAMAELESLGDVLHRQLKASDVGEQYRDLEIRIDSARHIRQRLLALLEKANTVQESLAIEAQVERLTKEIEQLEGRLRYLTDQIALSTITLTFRPLAEEQLSETDLKLPFPWLEELGLNHLRAL